MTIILNGHLDVGDGKKGSKSNTVSNACSQALAPRPDHLNRLKPSPLDPGENLRMAGRPLLKPLLRHLHLQRKAEVMPEVSNNQNQQNSHLEDNFYSTLNDQISTFQPAPDIENVVNTQFEPQNPLAESSQNGQNFDDMALSVRKLKKENTIDTIEVPDHIRNLVYDIERLKEEVEKLRIQVQNLQTSHSPCSLPSVPGLPLIGLAAMLVIFIVFILLLNWPRN